MKRKGSKEDSMTRAQVTLNPSESKKLIAKGILEIDFVKRALKEGIVAIHPSSTTYFLPEMIAGEKTEGIWVIGMISPRGQCVEALTQRAFEENGYNELSDPNNFPFSWIFKKGEMVKQTKLSEILDEMGEGDVYIKGVNAIDTHGYVGTLIGSLAGGTIGKAVLAQKKKGFHIIYVAGLEKLIPTSIKEVTKEAGRPVTSDAMGIPCGIFPVKADPFTEIQSLKMLTGVEAIPIAAGGLGGGEGSILMVVKGEEKQVQEAVKLVKQLKGAKLPEELLSNLVFEKKSFKRRTCHFRPQLIDQCVLHP